MKQKLKDYPLPVLETYDTIEQLTGYYIGEIEENNSATSQALLHVLNILYEENL